MPGVAPSDQPARPAKIFFGGAVGAQCLTLTSAPSGGYHRAEATYVYGTMKYSTVSAISIR